MPRVSIREVELTESDLVSIQDFFNDIPDARSTINRKHLLSDLLVICICGVLAGADGPIGIGQWAQSHAAWLQSVLPLPNGIPSHDTLGRALAALKPAAFQACFEAWISSLRQLPPPQTATDRERPAAERAADREQVAIDGKVLRRSHDRRQGWAALQLVSAWSVTRGISLGQLATADKSNEITAFPELIKQLHLEKTIVTIDAAGCQKEIAAAIRAGQADYVLALKGNHEKLYVAVVTHALEQMELPAEQAAYQTVQEIVKGHGRIDELTYYQFPAPTTLPGIKEWAGLATIGVAVRISKRGDKVSDECRYYLSSLPLEVKPFARCVRGHWGIENSLHWTLDVTFREDECRVRDRHAADNLAWLKRFAITLLKQQTDKSSIAMRRRTAGWNVNYLAQVLGLNKT